MGRRLGGIALLLALGVATPAAAMADPLSGEQIRAWIDGNTIVGNWAGTPYRQYFGPDGLTTFEADSAPAEIGRWWVTEVEFCAIWPTGGQVCYRVVREGETLIWQTMNPWGENFTAEVLDGNQLRDQ
jgi:hypothetical protein